MEKMKLQHAEQLEESTVAEGLVNSEELEEDNTHEKAAKTLSRYLQEKLGENAPKVTLRFFAGPHEKYADADGIEERIRDADIFIPEAYGWTADDLDNLKNISSGETRPSEAFLLVPYLDKVFNALYATNKPVALVDVPSEKTKEMEQRLLDTSPNKQQGFEEALQQIDEALRNNAEILIQDRERYMLDQLGPKIVEVVETHQELKNKKELTVLLTLGYAHTGMIQELMHDDDIAVTKDLVYPISVFDYSHEALRRCFFNKEISHDLKEKVLFEEILMETSTFKKVFRDMQETNTFASFKRFIADAFSSDEIRELFEQWSQDNDFEKTFLAHLHAKNLRMPTSDEDAREIMAEKAHESSKILSSSEHTQAPSSAH